MQTPDIFAQMRPILSPVGSIIIAAGLLKFAGVQIPVSGSGLEIAFAGWLLKQI
jgi:hypothetical protein